MTKSSIYYGIFNSDDYGPILLGLCEEKIAFLGLTDAPREMRSHYKTNPFIHNIEKTRPFFEALFKEKPLKTDFFFTGTKFQHDVWKALEGIPRGETRSYSDVARAIGRPRAVRAVGTAIGHNPISLLIPCHRVLYSNGAIGNYRWGSALKKKLLDYEKRPISTVVQ
ncbi:MAG: methylated-DNA--[protein]-cysteine S-methyltransferase [Alphaproteobacteria bacterium]|nr:methylated-DNA--[protein]-cysteine S-methyltransferase [Alphaproteobacteria bacterium]NCP61912.1 methylated-DNA--[protein]-cysteine S-methyltransferase [Alphaproteobacteria bacterium]NCQ66211.1 methylated-DNA--[protein]-cysteine S-methyltransferase [Alphaproteobacteria bacterium]NCT06559.1 methylated-DNA--[protein]-cysteine S-methyltransferase [Alphaproteobacteria bacterium]